MSLVKSICCACRRHGFDSQHPYSNSQSSVTPISGNSAGTHMVHMHVAKTFIYIFKRGWLSKEPSFCRASSVVVVTVLIAYSYLRFLEQARNLLELRSSGPG